MSLHSFKYRKNIAGNGFYAFVELDLTLLPSKVLLLDINESVESEWIPAIRFGCEYFFEHFAKYNSRNGLSINIKEINTMVLDSSFFIVFFVVVRCLCIASGYPFEIIRLNEENGIFEVAK